MSSETRTQQWIVPGVLLFSLVLIQAPVMLGEQPPIAAYPLTLLPFLAAICSLLLQRPRWFAHWSVLLAGGYVLLVMIAAFRASYFDVITQNSAIREAAQFAVLTLLGLFAFIREARAEQRALYLRALCWAPVMYLAVNVALYFAGILPVGAYTADAQQPSTMLAIIGLPVNRVLFPMSGGPLGIAPTATIALVICAALWLRHEQRRMAAVGILISLFVILAIDSRGALLFALLAIALIELTPRGLRHGLGWVGIVLPVLPIVLVFALTGLAETEAGTTLDRGGTEDLGTGTGRTVVWGEVVKFFSSPNVDHILGYGQLGQVKSGASTGYAYLFADDANPLTHSAHNLILQHMLDLGWVGALCIIVLATVVIVRLGRRTSDPSSGALLAGVLALLLLGVVQADPTPVHPDSFAFWLLVVFAAARAREFRDRPGYAEPTQPEVHVGACAPASV